MKFVKMHGLGNDFILVDNMDGRYDDFDFTSFAKKNCRRNFGIGADGVLIISKSENANANMRLINSDGSEAEMCGNGIRCAARYLVDSKKSKHPLKINTPAGIRTIEKTNHDYRVNMGEPKITATNSQINLNGKTLTATLVDIGNPHTVIFVDNFEFDWKSEGKEIENHSIFPNRTNVEFVKVKSASELKVKVWERGAGDTLACGTGACASLAASIACKKTGNKATVMLPGGNLEIEQIEKNAFMTGPADYVFEGHTKP